MSRGAGRQRIPDRADALGRWGSAKSTLVTTGNPRDISVREKAAETHLAQMEVRYRGRGSPDGSLVVDQAATLFC